MNLFQDIPILVQAIVALLFGLIVGSFLNVVIYRVPRAESVVFPASHCGSCGAAVKPYDNIPLLSYALLWGRCRSCQAKISWIYPAVELWNGLLYFAVVYQYGITATAILGAIFLSVMIVLFCIDFKHQLLPNVITYPAFLLIIAAAAWRVSDPFLSSQKLLPSISINAKYLLAIILLLICAVAFWVVDGMDNVLFGKYFEAEEDEEPEDPEQEARFLRQHNRVVNTTIILGFIVTLIWAIQMFAKIKSESGSAVWVSFACENIFTACFGALVGGGVLWLLRAIYFYTRGFGGMGLGDIKMLAVIGALFGWQIAVLVVILASAGGALVGVFQVVLGRNNQGLKTKLPFGIFLGAAAMIALFFGHQIVAWYASTLP